MLKVVETKPTCDLYSIYTHALQKKMEELSADEYNRTLLKQLVFLEVRWINLNDFESGSEESSRILFDFCEIALHLIGMLTPAELITIFPVDKCYDGDKFECKDYFYTMNELQKIGMNSIIGFERVHELLWDYQNNELRELEVNCISIVSRLRQFQGQPGIAEEWARENGISVYYQRTDPATGQEYLHNENTGRTVGLHTKPYLKLIN